MESVAEVVLTTFIVGSAALFTVGIAWFLTKLICMIARQKVWTISAGIFLMLLWWMLLGEHAATTYIEDTHITHGHTHWGLGFARAAFENLQSEDWQIWLAALVFAHWIWRGSPESK